MPSPVSPLFNDATLRSLELTLDATAQRHAAIAQNIANINTPGYRRMDLSTRFESAMKQALQQLDQTGTTAEVPRPDIATAAEQGLPRQDGNTVNLESEMVNLMSNQARFDFASQLAAKKFRNMRIAITGRSA